MRQDAVTIFNAGVKAVDSAELVAKVCRLRGRFQRVGENRYDLDRYRRILVLGAGKASAAMAFAVEASLGKRITQGIVNVKYGHALALRTVEVVEAGHPLPDRNGLHGADSMLRLAQSATAEDLVLCLFSGGASALLPSPAEGLTLEDKQETIRCLLSCGADIHEINTIRKHTSRIKGGRLASACRPAAVVSLILSDVVGDDLDIIASGPTVPDRGTYRNCMDVVRKYRLQKRLPQPVLAHLKNGLHGRREETPKPGDAVFDNVRNLVIGNNLRALEAAARRAAKLGYRPLVLSSMLEGETRDAARFHAAVIKEILKSGNPVRPPACILSGGETTVTLSGDGKGGRNQEFALASALHLDGFENFVLLSAGTDGSDGPTDAAGAVTAADTLARAKACRLDARDFLRRNDAYRFFERLGDLFVTGPTRTNVMDLRLALVGPANELSRRKGTGQS